LKWKVTLRAVVFSVCCVVVVIVLYLYNPWLAVLLSIVLGVIGVSLRDVLGFKPKQPPRLELCIRFEDTQVKEDRSLTCIMPFWLVNLGKTVAKHPYAKIQILAAGFADVVGDSLQHQKKRRGWEEIVWQDNLGVVYPDVSKDLGKALIHLDSDLTRFTLRFTVTAEDMETRHDEIEVKRETMESLHGAAITYATHYQDKGPFKPFMLN
jgi:hypothetical protein